MKETRKAERDSHTGVQKMAVGHHIGEKNNLHTYLTCLVCVCVCVCVCVWCVWCVCAGERSHVIERHLNARTGERAKNQEFVNLEEGIYIIHRQSPLTSLFFTDRDALSHNTYIS